MRRTESSPAKPAEPLGSRLVRLFRRKPRSIRVLSIDGGGIRGILPAVVMGELERLTGRPVCELFDLVAGTSTGSLVGLALLAPDEEGRPRFKASEVARLYEIGGPRVFSRSVWHQIRAVGNLVDEKFPATGLEEMLHRVFGETRMSEALTETLVTAYDVELRRPHFFRTCDAKRNPDEDFPMALAVRAATAAPTYFEPIRLETPDKRGHVALIDGAVVAYNPALAAYVEARRLFPDVQDIVMVSLGTGQLTRGLPFDEVKNWGAARWAQPLFSLMCDGDASVVDYQMHQILPPGPNSERRYFRFQVRLDQGSDDMDDASLENMRMIRRLGEELVQDQHQALEQVAGLLIDGDVALAS